MGKLIGMTSTADLHIYCILRSIALSVGDDCRGTRETVGGHHFVHPHLIKRKLRIDLHLVKDEKFKVI